MYISIAISIYTNDMYALAPPRAREAPRLTRARINPPFIPPAHLQCPHCCNTIATLLGNTQPTLDLPFLWYAPYNIGNNNIV